VGEHGWALVVVSNVVEMGERDPVMNIARNMGMVVYKSCFRMYYG
jgi:hypothetical protein